MKSYVNEPILDRYIVVPDVEIRIHEQGIVTFFYKVDDEIDCEFGLLAEVGERWKRMFDIFIYNQDLDIRTYDKDDYYGQYMPDFEDASIGWAVYQQVREDAFQSWDDADIYPYDIYGSKEEAELVLYGLKEKGQNQYSLSRYVIHQEVVA